MNNINYREDQLPIISYENGTMAVPAVPGAGKTFIVTNLVAKLLCENKHKGGKILILTYMNSAVSNFKGRIKKILQDNEIKELTIVTCTNKGKDRLIVKAEIVEDKNNK